MLTSLRGCKVFRQSLFPIYKSAKFGYLLDCTCVQHLCALVSEIASSSNWYELHTLTVCADLVLVMIKTIDFY